MKAARKIDGTKFKDVNGKDIPEDAFLNDPSDKSLDQYDMTDEEFKAELEELGLEQFIPKK